MEYQEQRWGLAGGEGNVTTNEESGRAERSCGAFVPEWVRVRLLHTKTQVLRSETENRTD